MDMKGSPESYKEVALLQRRTMCAQHVAGMEQSENQGKRAHYAEAGFWASSAVVIWLNTSSIFSDKVQVAL